MNAPPPPVHSNRLLVVSGCECVARERMKQSVQFTLSESQWVKIDFSNVEMIGLFEAQRKILSWTAAEQHYNS